MIHKIHLSYYGQIEFVLIRGKCAYFKSSHNATILFNLLF